MKLRTAKRVAMMAALGAIGAVAAWQAAPALQNEDEDQPEQSAPKPPATETAAPTTTQEPAVPKAAPPPPPPLAKATPMDQRVATIGLLNKRNGLWRDLTLKPGEAIRVGDVVVRLRACETTAPWENEHYTGAFVQVIKRSPDNSWRRIFSGWLYKESPSLNVVEDPVYDVWTKACQMRHPDMGPDTIVARGGDTAPSSARKSASRRSSADDSEDE